MQPWQSDKIWVCDEARKNETWKYSPFVKNARLKWRMMNGGRNMRGTATRKMNLDVIRALFQSSHQGSGAHQPNSLVRRVLFD